MLVCKEKKEPKKRKCYLLLNFIYINKYYTMLLSVMAINQIFSFGSFLFWLRVTVAVLCGRVAGGGS